jgi:hypothetical protein
MTKKEAIAKLKRLREIDDIEAVHGYADAILCSLLVSLGYSEVVDEWTKLPKWYA